MFESLVVSRPPARAGTHRYFVSLAIHAAIVAGAVGLTRSHAATVSCRPVEREIVLVAPAPASRPPVPPGPELPAVPSAPAASPQPVIDAPNLTAAMIPPPVPGVGELLAGGALERAPAPSRHAGGGLPSGEPFSAAMVDEPVDILRQPVPRYPAAFAAAGIEGRVELEYVVDTVGRAEPTSIRAIASTHQEFEAAARAAVLESRYRPARLQGRVVRQLVRQALRFRTGR